MRNISFSQLLVSRGARYYEPIMITLVEILTPHCRQQASRLRPEPRDKLGSSSSDDMAGPRPPLTHPLLPFPVAARVEVMSVAPYALALLW
jgi:hypothetical protein